MNIKILSEIEARAMFDNDAPELPIRTLNEAGKQEVTEFVRANSRTPDQHNLDAWFAQAEDEAGNTPWGGAIILEMPSRMTRSGNPATLNIEYANFDWSILE